MRDTYNGLVVTSPENSALGKGKQMWECLDALAIHYESIDMCEISDVSKFSDDKWDVPGYCTYNFLWSKWLPEPEYFPLLMVCKVVAYHEISALNKSISTVRPTIFSFISVFKELLASKGILVANRNQPFQNLSHLELSDILHLAQMEFARKGTLTIGAYTGLNQLAVSPLSIFPDTEYMTSGISLPWARKSVTRWVTNAKNVFLKQEDASIAALTAESKIKSYPPLKLSVLNLLVQAVLPFIDEHFELIKNVFDKIEAGKELIKVGKMDIHFSVRSEIERLYGKQLDAIFSLTYIGEGDLRTISIKWFTRFEKHIQGAMAWLILLTTGLRNIDMRNLMIGCCQPSKRFDLLYYLITDIKKVNLTNYIIPVPAKIAKAVELAAIAKRNRTGNILLTQTHATGSDSSSSDPRKFASNQVFNKYIQDFANYYGIKLETISDDDQDATAHCVRATLAGYIGANSHAAVIILKRLFGHSNNLMPDAYLVNNPLIIKQRRKNITDAQEEQARIMSKNIVNGKVSGTKGRQMLEGLKHIKSEFQSELKNESLTEMDFHVRLEERLKEILLMRIRGEDIYAIKTPVGVICMRSQSDSTDSPCAKLSNHSKRKELNISKDVTDVFATLPNPAQCVGKECSDAILGEDWSRDLLHSFDFYVKLLKGQGHKNIDIRNQAKHFIKNYGPPLKDIYSDERVEAYFDRKTN
nr:site-specific integrase [Moritella viscosa]SHN97548.1 Phage integrase family protein [Moritella viscosa]